MPAVHLSLVLRTVPRRRLLRMSGDVVMLDLEYRHVDVFSRRALRGNGLVVVLNAQNPSSAVMQEVTREVRQFETAFLNNVDLTGRSGRLRIFPWAAGLDFAGHPVLG